MALTRKGQVYSVGNYLMTGKVLGKGHFAKVEEATHRIIGKKVAIKIIDLTCIKEDYARRNLHREPRVMAKLRHPCIAALYETMMHGPRLYVVMEAAGGGDLCSHVLAARGAARGLPEPRARALAAQLVSAVRHMHCRGVVHRDLKMENIMLDSTKQFIKIVDFGLSNVWCAGGALRTPCGSLEYAAPELFVDGRRYGPEVDLWSIGVIVYGMVTGGLPFAGEGEGAAGGAGGAHSSRPHLRAAIARGFSRKQRAALTCVSTECKMFIQQLLEPKVELRMKIEEAARHRWVKRPGMRMKTHPLAAPDSKANREIYRQISELCGQSFLDIVAQIKAEPFGATAGIYNIKTHLHQMQAASGPDLLWSSSTQEPRPVSPPEYHAKYEIDTPISHSVSSIAKFVQSRQFENQRITQTKQCSEASVLKTGETDRQTSKMSRPLSVLGLRKPVFRVYENGDGLDRRLPSINEHSNPDLNDKKNRKELKPPVRKDEEVRLNSCPNKVSDVKRSEFYRRGGDGLPSWRASGVTRTQAPRILIQSNATTIKRASLGNIVSPHSSSNSQCKSERAMPVGWYSNRPIAKESYTQRLRRTAPIK
ncbi:serine/threonine-protein kinase MARK2-like [Zerene cesonia]|uniref:serine/threonine-protein kinase MARK2-like n=1 Tax=Zerene cesonia TaxID=33412 RepID=UPI0018E53849|nr:serine/threonine-protein kinase MARK2-like [Zerene cesonia]